MQSSQPGVETVAGGQMDPEEFVAMLPEGEASRLLALLENAACGPDGWWNLAMRSARLSTISLLPISSPS